MALLHLAHVSRSEEDRATKCLGKT